MFHFFNTLLQDLLYFMTHFQRLKLPQHVWQVVWSASDHELRLTLCISLGFILFQDCAGFSRCFRKTLIWPSCSYRRRVAGLVSAWMSCVCFSCSDVPTEQETQSARVQFTFRLWFKMKKLKQNFCLCCCCCAETNLQIVCLCNKLWTRPSVL